MLRAICTTEHNGGQSTLWICNGRRGMEFIKEGSDVREYKSFQRAYLTRVKMWSGSISLYNSGTSCDVKVSVVVEDQTFICTALSCSTFSGWFQICWNITFLHVQVSISVLWQRGAYGRVRCRHNNHLTRVRRRPCFGLPGSLTTCMHQYPVVLCS